ncbi:hypothetical protein DMUE_6117 [Dictyocoela muelleri]|nr:hypothetical protein DMUE_6117 [Dictyocoela muelleri]
MNTPNSFEIYILSLDRANFLEFLMCHRYIKNEVICGSCSVHMVLKHYTRNIDGFAWRCMNRDCRSYSKYFSIRAGSFFEHFTIEMKTILRILCSYLSKQPLHSIFSYFGSPSTVKRILKCFIKKIPRIDFSHNKLGGPGFVVQVDETMLNYKCKSHRGRSASNRTDALCIVECSSGITRAYAQVIEDRRASTLIPIICSQVAPGSIIWTDEHRSYSQLNSLGFWHDTVCHKYEFINSSTGTNTQAVESFNNEVKYMIKQHKGVLTSYRQEFLNTFCFFFNNKKVLFERGLELLKVN